MTAAVAGLASINFSLTNTGGGGGHRVFTGNTATGTGAATVTMTTANGGLACGFTNGTFVSVSSVPIAPPAGAQFPQGLVNFQIGNCATTGISVTVTLTFPQPLPPGTVCWKYGPATKGAVPSWYVLPGANVAGNQITFTLTDGLQGDDDWSVNGALTDPGGPGTVAVPPGQQVPIPVLSSRVSLMATAALIFLLAALFAPNAFLTRRRVAMSRVSALAAPARARIRR